MAADLNTIIPDFSVNIINPLTGTIDPIWFQFLLKLFDRTQALNGAILGVTGSAPIVSTGGTFPEISITAATVSESGSMSAADKAKLDSMTSGAAVAAVSGSAPIVSSGGTSPFISITPATVSAAGSMSASDKLKLDGVTAGAAVASVSGTAPILSSGGATPAISISAATPGAAGSMSASDKTKLDALLSPVALNTIAPVIVANSTTDTTILTFSPAAGSLVAASAFNIKAGAFLSSAISAGTISIWVKLGATKIVVNTLTLPASALTARNISYAGTLTIRSTGVSGVLKIFGTMESDANVLTGSPSIAVDGGVVIDTTAANTFTLGMNWSVANPSNTITAHTASIIQEK